MIALAVFTLLITFFIGILIEILVAWIKDKLENDE